MIIEHRDAAGHVYIFRTDASDDVTRTRLLKHLGAMAADPTLSFRWADAASIASFVRPKVPHIHQFSPKAPDQPKAG